MEDVPRSFIKNVALQISDKYKLDNAPFSVDGEEGKVIPFMGRRRHIEKFLEFLRGTEKKGVFLVTGYKGMGKTSFVNHVVNLYCNIDEKIGKDGKTYCRGKSDRKRIIPIHLTLAQTYPKEIDILRLLVSSIFEQYNNYRYRSRWSKVRAISARGRLFLWKLFLLPLIFISSIIIVYRSKACSKCAVINDLFTMDWVKSFLDFIAPWLILSFFIYIVVYIVFRAVVRSNVGGSKAYSRIRELYEKLYASFSDEQSSNDDFSIPSLKIRFGNGEKRTRQQPMAEAKQIEFELQQFLNRVAVERKKKPVEFIFIFDELDKIETLGSSSYLYDGMSASTEENKSVEASFEREMRARKQAIVNIIASLKNFFTTAKARFIFIAGREMFDASLADVSDRQSSISSIFTYIFNIESLIKENDPADDLNKASLSTAIETYLQQVLFAGYEKKLDMPDFKYRFAKKAKQIINLCTVGLFFKSPSKCLNIPGEKFQAWKLYADAKKYYLDETQSAAEDKPAVEEYDERLGKLYFTLQSFVTFLTYRSNGSPQKLIKTIHEFIVVGEYGDESKSSSNESNNPDKQNIRERKYPKSIIYEVNKRKSKLYLSFDEDNQYRIGFINYLYRPLIISKGRIIKVYSDNIVVSTTYLFDHLLKFNPFAFSQENLETIPEVLSTNKTSFLRQHIRTILDHLGGSHIRETEAGLFEYKFYSRTINEIAYLSKVFEAEAAAFNFTLDEGYFVKRHIANKIKSLRTIYSNPDADHQIYSISHLSEVLGDLHFFDGEYDEAITAYSDAIKVLGPITIGSKTTKRDFVALIKNKLKLGLCFEKMSSYEEALASYADSCTDAKRFMVARLINGRPFDIPELKEYKRQTQDENEEFSDLVFYSSGLSNLLQLVQQGYLANIFMQEKIGMEGISNLKLSIGIGGFLKMFDGFIGSANRNHLLRANAYIFIGKLLYFKNNQIEFDLEYQLNTEKKILPENFLDQFKRLATAWSELKNNMKQPVELVSALAIYTLSLAEVISSKYDDSKSTLVAQLFPPEMPKAASWKKNVLKTLLGDLEKFSGEPELIFRAAHYRYIATLLSNIGDCLLGTFKCDKDKQHNGFLIKELFVFDNLLDINKKSDHKFEYFLKQTENAGFEFSDILRCYYYSGQYFLKYGRSISCSFQYNKILHVLKTVLAPGPVKQEPHFTSFLEMLKTTIVDPLLSMAAETSGSINAHIVQKALELGVNRAYSLNNISYQQETREPILLFYYIKLKLYRDAGTVDIKNLVSPLNNLSTQYTRMIELDFYAKYCELQIFSLKDQAFSFWHIIKKRKQYSKQAIYKIDTDFVAIREKREKQIVNCLFSRLAMVKLLSIYGPNYAIGHRYLAYTHWRIVEVLRNNADAIKKPSKIRSHLEVLRNNEDLIKKSSKIKSGLDELLGYNSRTSTDIIYHCEQAKQSLEKAIQLHKGGKEYRKTLADMIYLEDDFNDNAYHFGAALDRYYITNGVFKDQLKKCDDIIRESNQYSADDYIR